MPVSSRFSAFIHASFTEPAASKLLNSLQFTEKWGSSGANSQAPTRQLIRCVAKSARWRCSMFMKEHHRTSGIVKWFSRLKGYGFILPDEGDREVFVHYSAIDGEGYRNLYEGDRVDFDLVDVGKGPQAKRVAARR